MHDDREPETLSEAGDALRRALWLAFEPVAVVILNGLAGLIRGVTWLVERVTDRRGDR